MLVKGYYAVSNMLLSVQYALKTWWELNWNTVGIVSPQPRWKVMDSSESMSIGHMKIMALTIFNLG
jgi:hypothetical protein